MQKRAMVVSHKKQFCLSPVSPFEFGHGALSDPLASPPSPFTTSETEDPCLDAIASASFSDLLQRKHRLGAGMAEARKLSNAISRTHSNLESLVHRLPVLELAMDSVRSRSDTSNAVIGKIDRAMGASRKVLKAFHLLHQLQKDAARGIDDLKADVGNYIEIITRIEECILFITEKWPELVQQLRLLVDFVVKSGEFDVFRMRKLQKAFMAVRALQFSREHSLLYEGILDEALEHLETQFRITLRESKDAKIDSSFHGPLVHRLQKITEKLSFHGRFKKCMEFYLQSRVLNMKQSLQNLHPFYLQYTTPQAMDTLDWNKLQDNIEQWMHDFQILVKVLASERILCQHVFSCVDYHSWTECFANMATSGAMTPFVRFCEAIVKSKEAPHKLFKMLEIYDVLRKTRQDIERILEGPRCRIVKELGFEELLKKAAELASSIFLHFAMEIEIQTEDMPPDGSVLRLASYVVNYVKNLTSEYYRDAMTDVVKIGYRGQGDNTETKSSELQQGILGIIQALESYIKARGKMCNDRGLANLFLLNNQWYIFSRSRDSHLGAFLGASWLKEQELKVEKYSLEYQKGTWRAAVWNLSKEGLEHTNSSSKLRRCRMLLCQRVKWFQDAFDALYERHESWSIPDAELREKMGLAVLESVIEAYTSYLYSLNYILQLGSPVSFRYTADDMEQKLKFLFDHKLGAKKQLQIGPKRMHSNS